MLLSSRLAFSRLVRRGAPDFSTSALRAASNRAIVYTKNGDPASVLTALTHPQLSSPSPSTLNIKFLLAPINPADINVVEGVYPAKPQLTSSLTQSGLGSADTPVYVGGNEGLAEVTEVGSGVDGLKKGDWVIMTRPQAGTWSSSKNVSPRELLKVPRELDGFKLDEVSGATITVNPATAYNMIHDFTTLQEGDWLVQNGANSAVGQAVIQIAAAKGIKTLNFVRNRDNFSELKEQLTHLGATTVLTYDELADKSLRGKVKEWTDGKGIRLGLNCVGGKDTTLMTQLLGQDGHLVTYGAMSKQPLSLPTPMFIFKNLQAHGFWQSRWYQQRGPAEQEELMKKLVQFMSKGQLSPPEHEIVTIAGRESDEVATQKVRDIMSKLAAGRFGKKVLLRMEEVSSD
ncbi:hypothetical protein CCMSSC00406_0004873 [Pleurotus cornucopiae]|uniref:Uncharacterized protein n=1 Tax=Pleurotus cornucopiae TaxID=5321 RepID=A0ACB7J1J6_PLECO|nr:hypothetical protein CCMSSC00406_0004873 [Pleurotus cornucopiae]